MDLAKDLICNEIGKLVFEIMDNTKLEYKEIVDQKSYRALEQIKTIIENDNLTDFDCVEQIVRVFEDMGSNCGGRHDFG